MQSMELIKIVELIHLVADGDGVLYIYIYIDIYIWLNTLY